MSEQEQEDEHVDDVGEVNPKFIDESLEGIVMDVVRSYVSRRLKSKHKIEWGTTSPKDYAEKKEKLAKDAFLAVRSRPAEAFAEYFAGTLCSVPQFLGAERYRTLTNELRKDPARVRTLTLLALSAVSWSKKSKES